MFLKNRKTSRSFAGWAPTDQVGVYLSGGIDSSAVAMLISRTPVKVQALSLDFGRYRVERNEARVVANHLELPLRFVKCRTGILRSILFEIVWHLDMLYGDAVTGPLFLLGREAKKLGLKTVFNGEGGDQFFGGWSNKPMIAANLKILISSTVTVI